MMLLLNKKNWDLLNLQLKLLFQEFITTSNIIQLIGKTKTLSIAQNSF